MGWSGVPQSPRCPGSIVRRRASYTHGGLLAAATTARSNINDSLVQSSVDRRSKIKDFLERFFGHQTTITRKSLIYVNTRLTEDQRSKISWRDSSVSKQLTPGKMRSSISAQTIIMYQKFLLEISFPGRSCWLTEESPQEIFDL